MFFVFFCTKIVQAENMSVNRAPAFVFPLNEISNL